MTHTTATGTRLDMRVGQFGLNPGVSLNVQVSAYSDAFPFPPNGGTAWGSAAVVFGIGGVPGVPGNPRPFAGPFVPAAPGGAPSAVPLHADGSSPIAEFLLSAPISGDYGVTDFVFLGTAGLETPPPGSSSAIPIEYFHTTEPTSPAWGFLGFSPTVGDDADELEQHDRVES